MELAVLDALQPHPRILLLKDKFESVNVSNNTVRHTAKLQKLASAAEAPAVAVPVGCLPEADGRQVRRQLCSVQPLQPRICLKLFRCCSAHPITPPLSSPPMYPAPVPPHHHRGPQQRLPARAVTLPQNLPGS